MNWFVPFSVQLSSAAIMPAGSGTAATHSENCEDMIHVHAVIRSWFAILLHTENCRWGHNSHSSTVLTVALCHSLTYSGQRSWFTFSNHANIHVASCRVILLHSKSHSRSQTWFSDLLRTWITFALSLNHRERDSAGRSRTTDSLIIHVAEDVILIHVLCWQWRCVTHSLTQGRGVDSRSVTVLLKLALCC